MAGERFGQRARELLAAYIQTNLATHLAAVETAQALAALSIGRPSVVLRGFNPADPRDNKVEVHILKGGPKNVIDRQLFDYAVEVDFTLHAADAEPLLVQERLLQWESAWWLLTNKGATTLGGTVNGCVCTEMSMDSARSKPGQHVAIGVALAVVTIQEN